MFQLERSAQVPLQRLATVTATVTVTVTVTMTVLQTIRGWPSPLPAPSIHPNEYHPIFASILCPVGGTRA